MSQPIYRSPVLFLVLTFLIVSPVSAQRSSVDRSTLLASRTRRISVAFNGTEVIGASWGGSISADGRYVAFSSWTDNLIAGDTNDVADVFVYDYQTGMTELISLASNGIQGNDWSEGPSISADGRFVIFTSWADNLVAGDTNGVADIFVHDCQTGETRLVSLASDGTLANGESGTYWSNQHISADGRFVVFSSLANNLVAEDTNDSFDIFIHDRLTGETERISVASNGTQGNNRSLEPSISADGRFVAFQSEASNLIAEDTNSYSDVFVHDRSTDITERVSVASDGTQGNFYSEDPSISADGHFVVFDSLAYNLVVGDINSYDVFIHDRLTGVTELVSVASDGTHGLDSYFNEEVWVPSISTDGRFVAFTDSATNLVEGDTNGSCYDQYGDNHNCPDVFIRDRQTGVTERVSVGSAGTQGNQTSWSHSISADGCFVVFSTRASTLVIDDTDGYNDVFVRNRCVRLEPPVFLVLLVR